MPNLSAKKPAILMINGSLGGEHGNTAALEEYLLRSLFPHASCERLFLADIAARGDFGDWSLLPEKIAKSDGFVFTSGTYWDSWGSPLQQFLERSTDFEGSSLWLGKPAAVIVTMHSVGGKSVLSRLQGVLSTLGLQIPPMSGMVYSLANHWALRASQDQGFGGDLWRPEDLEVVAKNLLEALRTHQNFGPSSRWTSWPVDSGDPRRRWF